MKYYCRHCDKHWTYRIKTCIFCGNATQELVETEHSVIGYTQVHVPSKGHEDVPYFAYLLQDSDGNKMIKKSFNQYQIGELMPLEGIQKHHKEKIGIVGSGLLGFGIAEHLLRFDYPTIIKTRSEANVKKLFAKMNERLLRSSTPDQAQIPLSNLAVSAGYEDLEACDIIIEAAPEDIGIKKGIFEVLSETCSKKTIFATNTSSLSIDKLSKSCDRPQQFIGMHFFNPVSRMDLVEVVLGQHTSSATKAEIVRLSVAIQKKPIIVKNTPGFIVNRLLMPQINEAVALLENEVASKEDIDSAVKLGLNHPMGPLALADLIGIDTCVLILETLCNDLSCQYYKPNKLLYDMIKEGELGQKTGKGFYTYP